MRALRLSDLLKKGDRVGVSNITGREAAKVCAASQKYCGNIVGGWALGRDGEVELLDRRIEFLRVEEGET